MLLADIADRFAPSMRQHISLDRLYDQAARLAAADRIDATEPLAWPHACPFTLDGGVTPAALLARLSPPA